MARHNRRRTRAVHKVFTPRLYHASEIPLSANSPDSKLPDARHVRRSDLSPGHNRYHAWQARTRMESQEREMLKAERKRIFGGDGSDEEDDGLCLRMMDYFVKLDYLREE